MTVEDLSVAAAERYETKMLHDLQTTTRVRAPPRPDPPVFGRESMEDAISARVAVETADTEEASKKPPASARVTTIEDDVDAFFALFQRIESRLHNHLTEDDKQRIRSALSPPSQSTLQHLVSDPTTVTFVVSILLTGVVIYVCNSSRRSHTRTPYRGEGRSEVMTWNIGRLLKPFIRPH